MFNSEFEAFAKNKINLSPEKLQEKMKEVNSWVYPHINDGVYRCGFAKSQDAYNTAFENLFTHLDKMEAILAKQRSVPSTTPACAYEYGRELKKTSKKPRPFFVPSQNIGTFAATNWPFPISVLLQPLWDSMEFT